LSASSPGRFVTGKGAPETDWIGGWLGPRIGLDAVTKREFPLAVRNQTLV